MTWWRWRTRALTRVLTTDECQKYLHLPQGQCQPGTAPQPQVLTPGILPTIITVGDLTVKGKICEVTDMSGLGDQFFNQLAYEGIQDAAEMFDRKSAVLEAQQLADYQRNILIFLQSDCDLIVAPTGVSFSDIIKAAAEANPDQKFQIMDWAYDPPHDNVWDQVYAVDQAGFLAGYVAAAATKTGKIGVFGGIAIPPVTDFMNGFALGVTYYNEKNNAKVEVLGWRVDKQKGLFIGNFQSTEDGRRIGEMLMDQGVDIILPAAGSVGLGTAAVVKERGGAFIIGIDSNWAVTYPEYASIILTSIEKRLDMSVVSAVKSIVEGTFTGGIHVGTLENGGVSITPFPNLDALVFPKVIADLEQIKLDIIAGKIKTKP